VATFCVGASSGDVVVHLFEKERLFDIELDVPEVRRKTQPDGWTCKWPSQ
jgi:hypothetical protein